MNNMKNFIRKQSQVQTRLKYIKRIALLTAKIISVNICGAEPITKEPDIFFKRAQDAKLWAALLAYLGIQLN